SLSGTCINNLGGSGAANRTAVWTAPGTLSYDDMYVWDNTNKRFGLGSTTPSSLLSLSGNAWLDFTNLNLGSTTAATFNINYLGAATNTIISNKSYAWTIATSTT